SYGAARSLPCVDARTADRAERGASYGTVGYRPSAPTPSSVRPHGQRAPSAQLASRPTATTAAASVPEALVSARDPRVDTLSRAMVVLDGVLDGLGPSLLAQSGRIEPTAKGDGTPVTDADHEADRALTGAIRGAFPDHGIVSEEQETVAPATDWCW